jgi:hypothetical protein
VLRREMNDDKRIPGSVRHDFFSAPARLETEVVKIETQNEQVIRPEHIRREILPLHLPCHWRRPNWRKKNGDYVPHEINE